jgi:hypothetical protein
MDGWVDGVKPGLRECLAQSKNEQMLFFWHGKFSCDYFFKL